jgi:hypothetical protein
VWDVIEELSERLGTDTDAMLPLEELISVMRHRSMQREAYQMRSGDRKRRVRSTLLLEVYSSTMHRKGNGTRGVVHVFACSITRNRQTEVPFGARVVEGSQYWEQSTPVS